MMARPLIHIALALAAITLTGCARPDDTPRAVRDAVAAQLQARGVDARAALSTRDLFTRTDFAPSVQGAVIVDYAKLATLVACPAAGCALEIWTASEGGAYAKTFDRPVRGHRVKTDGARTLLEVDVHGAHCGGAPTDPCVYAFAWKDDRFAVVAPGAGAGRYAAPMLRAIAAAPLTPPQGVADRVSAFDAQCRTSGGVPDYGDALSELPDLGGAKAMLLDSYAVACKRGATWDGPQCGAGECGTTIFVQDSGIWRSVYEAPRGAKVAVVFKAGAASLEARAPCAACAFEPLVWDPGSRRLGN